MNVFFLTIGLCLSLSLQVSCDEAESQTDVNPLKAGISEFVQSLDVTLSELERNPIHVRAKRSSDSDECHDLQTKSLPSARQSIYGAWNSSMNVVVSVATAFNDIKKCASWNIFVSVPCGIKSVVEFYKAYRDNKPEIYQFYTDVKEATANATVNFVGCAKLLLALRKTTS